ncbi:MAG: caspase family protein [Sandaracinus sp.]
MRSSSRRDLLRGCVGTAVTLATTAVGACGRAAAERAVPATSPTPLAPPVTPPRPMAFEPSRTWLLSVGVLTFARADLFESFPPEGRQDDVLCDALIARGVPSAQVIRVRDGAATRAEIVRQLESIASRVSPGDDLLVYYAGHGVQDDDGTTYFTATDSGDDTRTGYVSHAAVLDTLDARFRGRFALLFADCCYSGALPMLLARRAAQRPYAGLASSLASEISTGHWTFTEALIAAFAGEPRVDRGHDGLLTLEDLARFAEDEMAFAEGQLAPFATGTVPTSFSLGPARALPFPRYGERVMARWSDGSLYPAHVTGQGADGLEIQYVGEDVSARVIQPLSTIHPYRVEEHPVGAEVEVRWNGRWYPATVREARLGVHRIHYEGFEDAWDEWVSRERIRPRRGRAASRRARQR